MSELQLPEDEAFVLCHWEMQAVAEGMLISEDAASDLLIRAEEQGRIEIVGTSKFAGVRCDGLWLVVVGRQRITDATHEWQTLRAMEAQLRE
jgi:hypothetical protein